MNGFYNVIKPIGWSSSDLVIKIRGILRRFTGQKVKVGHLGTLDPLATGVLGVAVGSATKLFDYFLTKRKTYVATCALGKETDTLDEGGEVVATAPVPTLSDEAILEVLTSFCGEIEQIPPRYSAKSVGGVKAYKLTRKGVDLALKPCHVTIYACRLLERVSNEVFRFEVECSGGTYIRSLCRDIGAALGLPSYMIALTRTKNGVMTIDNATTIEGIEKDVSEGFFSLEAFGKSLKNLDFSEDLRKKIENGIKMETSEENGLISVSIGGAFYAIGEVKDGLLEIVARDR